MVILTRRQKEWLKIKSDPNKLKHYKAKRRELRSKNRDKYNRLQAAWRSRNPACALKYKKTKALWESNNRQKINRQSLERYHKRKPALKLRVRAINWNDRDEVRLWMRNYHLKNRILKPRKLLTKEEKRIKRLAYIKRIRIENPEFRIRHNMQLRIQRAINGAVKAGKTHELIGCTMGELKLHLQFKFKPGMHWSNYGKWHIDHIRPCSSFSLSDPQEQRKCFHYTNLQPLWALKNSIKSDKYDHPTTCPTQYTT